MASLSITRPTSRLEPQYDIKHDVISSKHSQQLA
jgi:hypothetical protein